mmetsp:Transcript_12373/g.29011  ORF Transcript_12373/g.29011 Transcript_12373/m.29011 type:complete len:88 (+) Transcript_12373:823-1086(+)
MGRGNQGKEADRSVGSTILSHIRSGMLAFKAVEHWLVELGVKAMAEEAIRAERATVKEFMVTELFAEIVSGRRQRSLFVRYSAHSLF